MSPVWIYPMLVFHGFSPISWEQDVYIYIYMCMMCVLPSFLDSFCWILGQQSSPTELSRCSPWCWLKAQGGVLFFTAAAWTNRTCYFSRTQSIETSSKVETSDIFWYLRLKESLSLSLASHGIPRRHGEHRGGQFGWEALQVWWRFDRNHWSGVAKDD